MLLRLAFLLMLVPFAHALNAQSDPVPYRLFARNGKATRYKKLVKAARAADVILFGETHNDAVGHWLQNLLARDLHAKAPLSIGMEMFESDQQQALDGYLAGELEAAAVDSVGEGLWNNFKTDYQPLVDWAAANDVPVVATNVPRSFARMVFKAGFTPLEELSPKMKKLLPPLPIPYDASLPGYVRMLEMMPGGHGGETFPMAQAIKDATMAHFIATKRQTGRTFLHLNGSYHSDDFEGIGWYLQQYAPELKVLTISSVEQDDLGELAAEHKDKAHFILAVSTLMTKTY